MKIKPIIKPKAGFTARPKPKDMKALAQFDNRDKLRLLHDLFPEEITALLDHLLAVCSDFKENREVYAKEWNNDFMPFDYWMNLSEEAEAILKKYRTDMVRSSRVFSDQLSFTYAVIFVNDRIVKYAESHSDNEKFTQAVALLFE
ncbi:hypothetical protein [Nubsella zeaxanthinifaciens]|uniref:hypothetical protein n=1 Tax=Nubsella zeaxanthinifaciens TaxID=392412 RepID=UPI001F44B826|nr:hypothetical protein [Nubsella zeaxanthinifaciens]